jgi:hypothetical protein
MRFNKRIIIILAILLAGLIVVPLLAINFRSDFDLDDFVPNEGDVEATNPPDAVSDAEGAETTSPGVSDVNYGSEGGTGLMEHSSDAMILPLGYITGSCDDGFQLIEQVPQWLLMWQDDGCGSLGGANIGFPDISTLWEIYCSESGQENTAPVSQTEEPLPTETATATSTATQPPNAEVDPYSFPDLPVPTDEEPQPTEPEPVVAPTDPGDGSTDIRFPDIDETDAVFPYLIYLPYPPDSAGCESIDWPYPIIPINGLSCESVSEQPSIPEPTPTFTPTATSTNTPTPAVVYDDPYSFPDVPPAETEEPIVTELPPTDPGNEDVVPYLPPAVSCDAYSVDGYYPYIIYLPLPYPYLAYPGSEICVGGYDGEIPNVGIEWVPCDETPVEEVLPTSTPNPTATATMTPSPTPEPVIDPYTFPDVIPPTEENEPSQPDVPEVTEAPVTVPDTSPPDQALCPQVIDVDPEGFEGLYPMILVLPGNYAFISEESDVCQGFVWPYPVLPYEGGEWISCPDAGPTLPTPTPTSTFTPTPTYTPTPGVVYDDPYSFPDVPPPATSTPASVESPPQSTPEMSLEPPVTESCYVSEEMPCVIREGNYYFYIVYLPFPIPNPCIEGSAAYTPPVTESGENETEQSPVVEPPSATEVVETEPPVQNTPTPQPVIDIYGSAEADEEILDDPVGGNGEEEAPNSRIILTGSETLSGTASLNWSIENISYDQVDLQRIDNQTWQSIYTGPSGVFSYEDKSVTCGRMYEYRLIVKAAGRQVGTSNTVLLQLSNCAESGWHLALATTGIEFNDVIALSDDEAWTVGTMVTGGTNSPILLHYDGFTWRLEDVDSPTQLFAIDLLGNEWGWASGNGFIEHASQTWINETSDDPMMYGLDILTSDYGWSVGDGGVISHWNGSEWKDHTDMGTDLHDVSLFSESFGLAVGEAGMIVRWDAKNWKDVGSPVSETLFGVDVISASDAWAVGEGGVILHWDGANWTEHASPTGITLNDVYMTSGFEGWIVGEEGMILQWDGENWRIDSSRTNADLNAVSMSSLEKGWAVGDGGTILRYNIGKPDAVLLVDPQDVTSIPPEFIWYPNGNAMEYELALIDDEGNVMEIQTVTPSEAGCMNSYNLCRFIPNIDFRKEEYSWKIRAWNEFGYGSWSQPMSFWIQ